ncbi:MAG: cytochrome P450 [Deltaproteobacteria bacterium]|nr:cytochrome P450 [Deltaproteobacteria bacterium]MBW2415483.1 cytochrome P450 [Deltaproteobacteria bacterium]
MALGQDLRRAMEFTVIRSLLGFERVTSGVVWDPVTPAAHANPYPMYQRLREKDPVHRSRLAGCYVLSRYDDVASVLKDERFSANERNLPGFEKMQQKLIKQGVLDPDEPEAPMMLRMDAPDHTRLRTLVNKTFTPGSIRRLMPRIDEIVNELVDELSQRGEMDLIADFAHAVPVIVIAEMLGVPSEDRARFRHWSNEIVRNMGISNVDDARAAAQASRELRAYFESIAEERRRNPQDDLLSGLLQAEEEGDRLTWDEVVGTLILLLVAGNETTTNLIGNGMLALLRHPEQLEELRGDPGLTENAVEEMLRYDPPVQATSRIALEDVQFDGGTIPKLCETIVLIGSANRDPEQFDAPDAFDLRRTDNRHLSFGFGVHFCLGSHLARYEGRTAIRALVDRFPGMKLATDQLEWRKNPILHGLRSLPVRW